MIQRAEGSPASIACAGGNETIQSGHSASEEHQNCQQSHQDTDVRLRFPQRSSSADFIEEMSQQHSVLIPPNEIAFEMHTEQ